MLGLDAVEERVSEVGWVTDHLADLESDLSVLHRVDDMWSMPGARFLRLAKRTVAYRGVMQARAQALMDAEAAEAGPVAAAPAGPVGGRRDVVEIDATPAAVASRPELAGLIDWGKG